MKKQTSMYLTEETKLQSVKLAKSQGLTLSVFVEQVLRAELKKAKRNK